MKKSKKSIVIILVLLSVFFIAIVVFASFSLYSKTDRGVINSIEKKYSVHFSNNVSLKCKIETPTFRGEGIKYYVLQFKERPNFISNFASNNLKQDENYAKRKEVVVNYFNDVTSNINETIEAEYLPNWEKECSWNDGTRINGMMAIYDNSNKSLFIAIVTT